MPRENARRLLSAAPDHAARLLQTAHADLREAIAELQRLAQGIDPAELPERGLIPPCGRSRAGPRHRLT